MEKYWKFSEYKPESAIRKKNTIKIAKSECLKKVVKLFNLGLIVIFNPFEKSALNTVITANEIMLTDNKNLEQSNEKINTRPKKKAKAALSINMLNIFNACFVYTQT